VEELWPQGAGEKFCVTVLCEPANFSGNDFPDQAIGIVLLLTRFGDSTGGARRFLRFSVSPFLRAEPCHVADDDLPSQKAVKSR
jgi:hypothetical protein